MVPKHSPTDQARPVPNLSVMANRASAGGCPTDNDHGGEAPSSSNSWYDRVVEADGDLVSDQLIQAVNRLGRLVERSGFDES